MKSAFKILSISLLLMVAMVSAYANPEHRQEWRDDARGGELQQGLEQREQANGERQVQKG